MKIYVGTSGYQYKEWGKVFYPEDIPQRKHLEYLSSQLPTVEINSSFYRLPTKETFARWANQTSADFRFAIKGSRYISHRKRLKDVSENVTNLMDRLEGMDGKVGAILWQLPESFKFNLDRLENFLLDLHKDERSRSHRHAIELRHPTWFNEDTYSLLRLRNISLVLNQSSIWPYIPMATADWLYVRLHGPEALYASGYSDTQLSEVADTICKLSPTAVFAYFNNDVGVHAPRNARRLLEILSDLL